MARPATKATALWVIRRLRAAGHEALLAGGCVRDELLGLRSSDYDVATDATPRQVRRLFGHVLLVGAKFGVAMIIHRGRRVEVTTFRSDLSYSDGRRPDAVRFSTPREDALRRDFTINGMFRDPIRDKVIDYVGGRKDLARRVVRTIGPPEQRFGEDYLRMIRAVRFAVRFDFRIAPATAAAVRKHAGRITSISGERLCDEMSKMLAAASAAEALRTLNRLGLAREILPELFVEATLWPEAVARVAAVAARRDLTSSLGALTAGLEPKAIRRITRRWGASNDLRDGLCFLAKHRQRWSEAATMPLCELKRLLAAEHFERLRRLWRVDERAATGRTVYARRIARRIARIAPDQVAPPALVTGTDLMAMGLSEGRRLGKLLRVIYDAQLNEEFKTPAAARAFARHRIAEA